MTRRNITLTIAALLLTLIGFEADGAALHVFTSGNLHCNDSVLVWSPNSSTDRNLPTLFLLHGWSGSYRNWGDKTDLQAVSDRTGFRIICPDGLYDSWYVDNCDTTKVQWRRFFWEELWPEMSLTYGLEPDRTFISGLSMGGYGAISIFLDHPEKFKGAGSMSGVLSFKYSGGSKSYIPLIFGAQSIEEAACERHEDINRLEAYKESLGEDVKGKMMVISCGEQDKTFVGASKDFSEKCTSLDIPHVLMLSPGRHRWPYWIWALDYHLSMFRDTMDGRLEEIWSTK